MASKRYFDAGEYEKKMRRYWALQKEFYVSEGVRLYDASEPTGELQPAALTGLRVVAFGGRSPETA